MILHFYQVLGTSDPSILLLVVKHRFKAHRVFYLVYLVQHTQQHESSSRSRA